MDKLGIPALLALCAGLSLAPVLGRATAEAAVTPDYLFKLIPFVDWPGSALASSTEPFRICIVGEDPFGDTLDQAGRGQTAGHRPIAILRFKSAAPDEHCQLMYIAGDALFVSQSLTAVSGTPVLTVTAAQDDAKGIVNFVATEKQIRLEIDQDAAVKNHLNVSSKLLGIAASPDENAP